MLASSLSQVYTGTMLIFRGLTLTIQEFENSWLPHAKFVELDLYSASFTASDLFEADFSGSINLEGDAYPGRI